MRAFDRNLIEGSHQMSSMLPLDVRPQQMSAMGPHCYFIGVMQRITASKIT